MIYFIVGIAGFAAGYLWAEPIEYFIDYALDVVRDILTSN